MRVYNTPLNGLHLHLLSLFGTLSITHIKSKIKKNNKISKNSKNLLLFYSSYDIILLADLC